MSAGKESTTEANHRIAKNTLMLYFRMFITMLVGVFTSRVFLSALGFEDYGIYNVVAGVVSMMGIITGMLTQGTMRFMAYSIGSENETGQANTFSALMSIHIAFALLLLLVGETLGLWFLNTYVVFDVSRTDAVNFVYQLSLIGACVAFIQIPFNAAIIAKEKMNVFAYISIYDVVVKLLIVLVLFVVDYDKLKLYSTMLIASTLTTFMIYRCYCRYNFNFCKFNFLWDRELYRRMSGYVGWNAIGVMAFTIKSQSIVVLVNMFFGPIVNAAYAIASTIANMVNQFINGFQTAVNPQIIKSYAGGDVERSTQLVINNAKFSSYLLLLFAVPLFIEMEEVLTIWLGKFPEYTVDFGRFVLVQLMFQAIDYPVGYGIHAVGKMKLPNITSSFIYMSILPICYLSIKLGANPITAYLLSISVYPFAFVCDILILRHYTKISILTFIKEVLLRTIIIIAVAAIMPTYIHYNMESGFMRLVVVCVVSLVISSCLIYRFGLGVEARQQLLIFVKSRLLKR
ncbi:MAG: lipopolysaccharide biosynthesis protein [Lachnospiraceae bacterium]